jgi:hypothetical protein
MESRFIAWCLCVCVCVASVCLHVWRVVVGGGDYSFALLLLSVSIGFACCGQLLPEVGNSAFEFFDFLHCLMLFCFQLFIFTPQQFNILGFFC